jgi:site-specific recombinase XerD
MDIKILPKEVQKYLKYLERKEKSSKSIDEIGSNLKLFMEFVNKKHKFCSDIKDITLEHITKITNDDVILYDEYCKKQGNIASTRVKKLSFIKNCWERIQYENKKDIIPNIVSKYDIPKTPKRLPKPLSLEQARTLVDTVDSRYKERDSAIIDLFLNAGLRVSELVSVDLDHINGDTLNVIGKGNKERSIDLPDETLNKINIYLETRKRFKNKALFLSQQKDRISKAGVQKLIKEHMAKNGIESSVHKLRHTFCTLQLEAGTDITTIKELAGHGSINTTLGYTKVSDKTKREASKRGVL